MLNSINADIRVTNRIEHESRTPPPPEDELSQSLDKLMKDGVLSVALVFEARVLLDIQHIMGDEIKRGYQDLLQVTSSIDKIMNLKVVDGAWDVGGTGERWVSAHESFLFLFHPV